MTTDTRVPASDGKGRAPVDSVVVMQVLRTLARTGKGTEGDPVREVAQYWTMDGALLWVDDPERAIDPKTGLCWWRRNRW